MKQYNRVFLLIMTVMAVGCNQRKATVEGVVEGGAPATLILEKLDVNRTIAVDSVEVDKRGSFRFRTELEEPEFFVLRNPEGQILNLLIHPGEHVYVSTSKSKFGTEYSVTGSPDSELVRILSGRLDSTRSVLDSLRQQAASVPDPESREMVKIRSAYAKALIDQKRFTIRFLVENMGSLAGIYALYQKFEDGSLVLDRESDLQYFKAVSDSLDTKYSNSSLVRSLRADIDRREETFRQNAQLNSIMESAEEVKGSPELSIPDREGREVKLSSLRGKVCLLVFWASGDRASIEALLQLKSTYSRYRSKGFEIYAVSLDNMKINWMRAIDFNEFDWINVSELNYPDSRANRLFNVTAIPTSFLINREGDIVAKNLYGRTLETWLDNLI